MITNFTKPTLNVLRQDINAALTAVAAKHGITLAAGNISFTPTTCTIKVEAAVTNPETGRAASREEDNFVALAGFYGLAPTDLGRQVSLSGQTYEIVGLKPKAHKRPVLLKSASGRMVVADADLVRRLLATAA
jgi:hypothetical protein